MSSICLTVASLTACFVLFQTVPVLVTGVGWEEEEAARRTAACKTIGSIASLVVYLGSVEFHTAAFSALLLRSHCSNGFFYLNADYCLCFQFILSPAGHSHSTSTLWLKFPVEAMLSSGHKLLLLAIKVYDKLSDILVQFASVFAFRIVFPGMSHLLLNPQTLCERKCKKQFLEVLFH